VVVIAVVIAVVVLMEAAPFLEVVELVAEVMEVALMVASNPRRRSNQD